MPPIRYTIAFFSACLIVAGGIAFCAYIRQSFWEDIRQELRDAKDAGELPAELEDVDIENIHLVGLDIELSNQQMFKVQLVDLLADLWFIWVLAVFGICFGVAYLLGRTPNLPS